ncbi:MAG: hypothetical protein JWR80_1777 [Bradyrhizobium sp.]|nr:hypothetical protein [Bradyrhizobium sp.]
MNIRAEDEIEIPALCNCARLRRAARVVTRFYDQKLAPAGITTNQFTILGYLKSRGGIRIAALGDLLALDRATIGHNLRPLERDGLLTITPDDNDRRAREVRITPAGLARVAEARALWDEAQARFETDFGTSEAAELRTMVDRVAALPLAA